MPHQVETNFTEQLSITDSIRHQLIPENGVATNEIQEDPLLFNVLTAHGMAEHSDMTPEASVTQDLIAVADTGNTLFSVVRASVVDRNGSASTRLFLTEVPRGDEQSGRLVHEFKTNPSDQRFNRDFNLLGQAEDVLDTSQYDGVQPIDGDGRRSRLQMMLNEDGNLYIRTDRNQPQSDDHLDRKPVLVSYSFGHAVDTPPTDWAMPAETFKTQQYYQESQYAA